MANCIYPVPEVLEGLLTPAEYNELVRVKAWALLKRDRKRKLPGVLTSSIELYKETVNSAFAAGGLFDPYTGETLEWKLVRTWDPKKAKNDPDYEKQFYLMPTIDHIDPYGDVLAFAVCSWEVNCCKSFLNPQEFIGLCGRIVNHRQTELKSKDSKLKIMDSARTEKPAPNPLLSFLSMIFPFLQFPALYILPQFLAGICTQRQYSKWLLARAKALYKRDKKNGKLCALHSSRSLYRKAIHEAVCAAGLFDPYTGDRMAWEKIGTWDATKGSDNHDIFRKEFTLLPTVDHKDPAMKVLSFEICSWLINCCKSGRTTEEFVGLCGKVAENKKS
jgi:hypothetical protein